MMSDAIDYNEWKFCTREEGTVYSLHSFFRKLAQGIGPSVVIALLGFLGYVESAGTTGQTPEMAYKACWLVAGLYLFSAVCQFVGIGLIYNLDKKTLAKMTEELNVRRANAPVAEESKDVVAPEVNQITIE
jgi:GPH family glycoside/pentoside/hexuronide:cation symporter